MIIFVCVWFNHDSFVNRYIHISDWRNNQSVISSLNMSDFFDDVCPCVNSQSRSNTDIAKRKQWSKKKSKSNAPFTKEREIREPAHSLWPRASSLLFCHCFPRTPISPPHKHRHILSRYRANDCPQRNEVCVFTYAKSQKYINTNLQALDFGMISPFYRRAQFGKWVLTLSHSEHSLGSECWH